MNLFEVAEELARRFQNIFLKDASGRRPVFGGVPKFQTDPHWQNYLLFYEYFHGDNGAGFGASHQTGWTAGGDSDAVPRTALPGRLPESRQERHLRARVVSFSPILRMVSGKENEAPLGCLVSNRPYRRRRRLRNSHSNYLRNNLRRATPATPSRPVPRSARLPGSGVAAGTKPSKFWVWPSCRLKTPGTKIVWFVLMTRA